MICFSCEQEIDKYPCPFCGYDGEEDLQFISTCPNLDGTVCIITENICCNNDSFMECEVKNQAERESFF